jgi:hypothetical protein
VASGRNATIFQKQRSDIPAISVLAGTTELLDDGRPERLARLAERSFYS